MLSVGLSDLVRAYWWEEHLNDVIIWSIVGLVLIAFLLMFALRHKIKSSISKAKHCNVTLYGVSNALVKKGETYSPTIPEGGNFKGWYLDSALTVPWVTNQKVKSDFTLYPKW